MELINLSKKIDDALEYSLGRGHRFKTSIDIMRNNTYRIIDSTVDSTSHTLVLGVGGKSRLKVTLPKNLGLFDYARCPEGQRYSLPSDVFRYHGGCPVLGNVFNGLSFGDSVLGRIVFHSTSYFARFAQDYAGYPVDYTLLPRLRIKYSYEISRGLRDRHLANYRFYTYLNMDGYSLYNDPRSGYMLSDCGTGLALGGSLASGEVSLELEPH